METIRFLTGCEVLDLVLGGDKNVLGVPSGRFINIVGDRSSGKTFLANEFIAFSHYQFGDKFKWVYDDCESGYTFNTEKLYGFEIMPEVDDPPKIAGRYTEKEIPALKESGLASTGKPSAAERIQQGIPSTNTNINENKIIVNNFIFESLLDRGAIIEFQRNKRIHNRQNRYLDTINHLESITTSSSNETLKKSNDIFIQKEKKSQFWLTTLQKLRVVIPVISKKL